MVFFLLNLALGGLAFIFWLFAVLAVTVGAYIKKRRVITTLLWCGMIFVLLAILATIAKIATAIMMWQMSGAWYAALNMQFAFPVMLPAELLVLCMSAPKILQLLRSPEYSSIEAVKQRVDWQLIVPMQLAAAASLLALLGSLHVRTINFTMTTLLCWLIQLGLGTLLFWRHGRFAQRVISHKVTPKLRHFTARVAGVLAMFVLVIGGLAVIDMSHSRLPAIYNMAQMPSMDTHDMSDMTMSPDGGTSVAGLTEKDLNGPIKHYTLTAEEKEITLSSGKKIQGLAFNGQVPGPELRATEGDILEVTLKNDVHDRNVTLHWHGLDVPNAEDGVAGLTQDAVRPNGSFTYKFKVKQTGTFWYHSHQQSLEQVEKGLYGALVVQPRNPAPSDKDITLMYHDWNGTQSFNLADEIQKQQLQPGVKVRLRVINTSNKSTMFTLSGTPFTVAAIDSNAVNDPTQLENARVRIPGGGKRDLLFTMPAKGQVFFGKASTTNSFTPKAPGITWSADGATSVSTIPAGSELDLLKYGKPATVPFIATSHFDKTFDQYFDPRVGFFNGRQVVSYAINGALFPDTPSLMVREGDTVKVTFHNRTPQVHPMHLHGHQMLVLSRNGQPAAGSPWWTDTLDVLPGESYEVAFTANNPGLWMDHCHNLEHAADGMVLHLMYEGYSTPYRAGSASGNIAE